MSNHNKVNAAMTIKAAKKHEFHGFKDRAEYVQVRNALSDSPCLHSDGIRSFDVYNTDKGIEVHINKKVVVIDNNVDAEYLSYLFNDKLYYSEELRSLYVYPELWSAIRDAMDNGDGELYRVKEGKWDDEYYIEFVDDEKLEKETIIVHFGDCEVGRVSFYDVYEVMNHSGWGDFISCDLVEEMARCVRDLIEE